MKQLKHIWFIAVKDLKLFLMDRTAFFMFIIFPFLFVALFSLMSAGGEEDPRLELHLVTREAKGGLSYQIIGAIETKKSSKLKPGEPEIIWDKDYEKSRKEVKKGKLDGFLVFPSNFTEAVMMGYGTELKVVSDPEATNARAALSGLAKSVASQVGAQQVANNATIGLFVEHGLKTGHMETIGPVIQQVLMGQKGNANQKSYIKYKTEKVGEKEAENAANWVLSGYLVMFVFFAAAQSAEMIVRERQNLTLERLLTSSVRKESILGGVFLGTSTKGLLQIIIFWLLGILVFKADLGQSPAAVILVSFLMVIMSAAFGVMLATLVKTQRSAGSIAVLASLVLAPLGGCWWPLFITPRWMQFIAKVTPHAWANTAFNKLMLFGADFSSVVPEMLALVGFTFLFGAIAIWRFGVSAVMAE